MTRERIFDNSTRVTITLGKRMLDEFIETKKERDEYKNLSAAIREAIERDMRRENGA